LLIYAKLVEVLIQKAFLKIDFTPVPTFCGYIVNRTFVIDVIAMTVKLGNRLFFDDYDLVEYQRAVGEWLSSISNLHRYNAMVHTVGYKYGVDPSIVHSFYSFLSRFASGRLIRNFKDPALNIVNGYPIDVKHDLYWK
jgi:hypothetical protein